MTEEVRKCVEILRYCEESGARCGGCPSGETNGIPNCHSQSHIADLIESLSAQLDQVTRERDAAGSNKFQYETGFIKGFEAAYPKWISVKERLPEDGQRVVGIAENGMTGIMDYRDDGTPFAARIFGVYFSNITHWMPLPSPPKEDE